MDTNDTKWIIDTYNDYHKEVRVQGPYCTPDEMISSIIDQVPESYRFLITKSSLLAFTLHGGSRAVFDNSESLSTEQRAFLNTKSAVDSANDSINVVEQSVGHRALAVSTVMMVAFSTIMTISVPNPVSVIALIVTALCSLQALSLAFGTPRIIFIHKRDGLTIVAPSKLARFRVGRWLKLKNPLWVDGRCNIDSTGDGICFDHSIGLGHYTQEEADIIADIVMKNDKDIDNHHEYHKTINTSRIGMDTEKPLNDLKERARSILPESSPIWKIIAELDARIVNHEPVLADDIKRLQESIDEVEYQLRRHDLHEDVHQAITDLHEAAQTMAATGINGTNMTKDDDQHEEDPS
jgi:hypothetical protein